MNKLSGFAPKVGSAATNGSFENFRDRLITSRVEVTFYFLGNLAKLPHGFYPQVEINYDNSLGECLVDNQCLDDIFYFLNCMAVRIAKRLFCF